MVVEWIDSLDEALVAAAAVCSVDAGTRWHAFHSIVGLRKRGSVNAPSLRVQCLGTRATACQHPKGVIYVEFLRKRAASHRLAEVAAA